MKNNKILEELLDTSDKRDFYLFDTSFLSLCMRSLDRLAEDIKWKEDLINTMNVLKRENKNVLTIEEVIFEIDKSIQAKTNEDSVNSFKNRKNREYSEEINRYCNLFLNLKRILKRNDPRKDFNSVQKNTYDSLLKYAKDVCYQAEMQRQGDSKKLQHKLGSFGAKLETDPKIIATGFTLANLGTTIILTRDGGLSEAVRQMKDDIYFKKASSYQIPRISLRNIRLLNPNGLLNQDY